MYSPSHDHPLWGQGMFWGMGQETELPFPVGKPWPHCRVFPVIEKLLSVPLSSLGNGDAPGLCFPGLPPLGGF